MELYEPYGALSALWSLMSCMEPYEHYASLKPCAAAGFPCAERSTISANESEPLRASGLTLARPCAKPCAGVAARTLLVKPCAARVWPLRALRGFAWNFFRWNVFNILFFHDIL